MRFRLSDHAEIARRRVLEREQAFAESVSEDLGDELKLPEENAGKQDDPDPVSLETQLSDSNVGFRLLQKMGWKGKGLGKDEQGIVEPIRSDSRDAKLGLGKQEEVDYYTAEENIHRKKLEAEVIEDDEATKKREVEAERELKIQSEVKEIRKPFFCDLCNKQYKFAVEFEAHLSSFEFLLQRFKDMRDLHSTRDRDDRQKREQQRQDKEMAKQQAEAQRQQLELKNVSASSSSSISVATPPVDKGTIRFGLSSSASISTRISSSGAVTKKMRATAQVPAIFSGDSDEED